MPTGRIALSAGVLFLLGTIAHTMGSGTIDALGLVIAGLFSGLFAVPVARLSARGECRQITTVAPLAGVLLLAQVLMHLVFAVSGGHSSHAGQVGESVSLLPAGSMLFTHAVAAAISAVLFSFAHELHSKWRHFFHTLFGGEISLAPIITIAPRATGVHTELGFDSFSLNTNVTRGPPYALAA